jgi:hypothetical protein
MRWGKLLFAMLAGPALLFAGAVPRAQAGFVIASALNLNQVLDVPDSSLYDHTLIQMFHFNGGDNQLWDLYEADYDGTYLYVYIINRNSGKAVDVPNGSSDDQIQIQQFTWNGGDNQQWALVDVSGSWTHRLFNRASGKFLDLPNGATADHTIIQQFHDNGGLQNQQWVLIWDED